MMKIITNTLRNLIKKDKTPLLGRWKLDYCQIKINKKIDLSNKDHCGPCGIYNDKVNKFKIEVNNYSYDKIQSDNYISILEIENL